VKTTLQKLVVSLLVLVMFLTSNGTLVLAAEIDDVVDYVSYEIDCCHVLLESGHPVH
jgi:hypothetical protein